MALLGASDEKDTQRIFTSARAARAEKAGNGANPWLGAFSSGKLQPAHPFSIRRTSPYACNYHHSSADPIRGFDRGFARVLDFRSKYCTLSKMSQETRLCRWFSSKTNFLAQQSSQSRDLNAEDPPCQAKSPPVKVLIHR